MRKLLLLTAALSLLSAPAAMAQHRHDGGGGRHGAAAQHQGGGGRVRANRRAGLQNRAYQGRRAVARPQRRSYARSHARGAYGRRAYARGAYAGRAYRPRAYAHASHYRGGVSHRYGGRHWRHVGRVGRWSRGGRLPYGYWHGRPWVNWRAHYLWAPPYGDQWIYVDGYYVLIAVGTGLILDIVAAY